MLQISGDNASTWKTMMTGSRWAIFPGASNWVCQTNHLYIYYIYIYIFTCIHRNIKYLYECMCISVLAECLTFSSLHISFGSQSPQVMIKQNGLKAVYLVWTCFGFVWPLAHLKDCDFYVYLSGVLFIAKVNGINGRNSLPSSKPCLILRHVPRWYISHQLDSIIFCKWQLLQFTSAYIYIAKVLRRRNGWMNLIQRSCNSSWMVHVSDLRS